MPVKLERIEFDTLKPDDVIEVGSVEQAHFDAVGDDWDVSKFKHTWWKEGTRLAIDTSGRPRWSRSSDRTAPARPLFST